MPGALDHVGRLCRAAIAQTAPGMGTGSSAALRDWQTFYLLGGGAAAVLIGLLFVVISLAVDLTIDAKRARALRGQ